MLKRDLLTCGKTLRIAFAIGLALSIGGCALGGGEPPQAYDLSAPKRIDGLTGGTRAQILIREPVAVKGLDSEQIAVRFTDARFSYIAGAQWVDRLPKLLQARIVETFERTGRARAVGRPGDNLTIDYQLQTDIRAFQLEASGGKRSLVEISVRLLNDGNGRVVATRHFTASYALSSDAPTKVVAGLNAALDDVLGDMVRWTFAKI